MRPPGLSAANLTAADRRRIGPLLWPVIFAGLLATITLPLTLAAAETVAEATPAAAESAELSADGGLDLPAVVDAALARDPAAAVVDARREEARLLEARAGSLLAGDVALALRWQDSGPLGRSGIRETEGGVELPIWRLGQRDAAARLAAGSKAQRDAEGQSRELRVAGEVREALWAVAIARVRVAVADTALDAARRLEAAVQRRIAVGDQAAADEIPARDWRLDREARRQEADIVRVHAELNYRLLTGLDRLPAAFTESVGQPPADGGNPLLAPLAAQLARTRAETEFARRSRGGNPRLTLGARNELGGPDNGNVASLGVGISIPLGITAASRAPEAAAAVAAAQAESELALAERRYQYLHHEAEHEFEAATEARDRLRQRVALAERELAHAAKAFAVGEIGLAERLLTETRARGVLGDAAAAELEHGRAIARLNQILGVMP